MKDAWREGEDNNQVTLVLSFPFPPRSIIEVQETRASARPLLFFFPSNKNQKKNLDPIPSHPIPSHPILRTPTPTLPYCVIHGVFETGADGDGRFGFLGGDVQWVFYEVGKAYLDRCWVFSLLIPFSFPHICLRCIPSLLALSIHCSCPLRV